MNITGFGTKILLDMMGLQNTNQIDSPAETNQGNQLAATVTVTANGQIDTMLTELSRTVQQQQSLMESLPAKVQELIIQTISNLDTGMPEIQDGMTQVVSTPRQISNGLMNLAQQLSSDPLPPTALPPAVLAEIADFPQAPTAPESAYPPASAGSSDSTAGHLIQNSVAAAGDIPADSQADSQSAEEGPQTGLSLPQVSISENSQQASGTINPELVTGASPQNAVSFPPSPTALQEIVIFTQDPGTVGSGSSQENADSLELTNGPVNVPNSSENAPVATGVNKLQTSKFSSSPTLRLVEIPDSVKMLPPKVLQQSAEIIRKLAAELSKYEPLKEATNQKGTLVSSFAVPLNFEQGKPPYPAFIHIFQQQDDSGGGEQRKETWVRVCLDTHNLGQVDTSFHLYGNNQLDIRVKFAAKDASKDFASYLPAIRAAIGKSLAIGSFNIGENS